MTTIDAVFPTGRVRFATLALAIFATAACPLVPTVGAAGPDAPGAAKFVVYFGLDIATELQGSLCPVVDGGDRTVQVLKNGNAVNVSLREARFKTAIEPKLSRTQATVDDLRGDRVYSPLNDPGRDAIRQQMVMETAQAHTQEVREIQANSAARFAASIERAASDPQNGIPQSFVDNAKQDAATAADNLNTAFVSPTFSSALPGIVDDNGAYDAFEATFRLSATEEHENAYGVLRLLVRDPLNPQHPMQTIKFFDLRKLGSKPRKTTVRQMGLPPGFGIDSYDVHVYADGREIPTNLSSNRVDLNEDEAHQFLVLRHLQQHRQATMPAQIIFELIPLATADAIPPNQAATNTNLAIDENGRVTRILPAVGIPTNPGPEVEAALRAIRFLPALVDGKPVASEGTFALGEFLR